MKTVAIAFVILSLASVGFCTNWESSGNWTTANTTEITAAIGVAMQKSVEATAQTGYNLGTFAQELSTDLEKKWDQFWNVFVVVQAAASDTVVYGYAFKDHWLWKNNVQFTGYTPPLSPPFNYLTGKNIGLIIWKDYNC